MEKLILGDCTLTLLDERFNLRRSMRCPLLDEWLLARKKIKLSGFERHKIQDLQDLLVVNFEGWNEQELALHFIGPIFSSVNFTEMYRFNLFSQRFVTATIGNYVLTGKPDGIIASGFREPRKPYFAFNEYKPEVDPDGDPAGQALGAMLIGQTLNDNGQPIYGCYIIGSNWRFMLLTGKSYCVSEPLSALTDDIFDIVRILKVLKINLLQMTSDNS
jgi:hypothetical protein